MQKYLSNAKESEFTQEIREALTNFIRTAFRLHVTHVYKEFNREFTSYTEILEKIKNMNIVTRSLDIPTRNKSDILRLSSV